MKNIYLFIAVISFIFLGISCTDDETLEEALKAQKVLVNEDTGEEIDDVDNEKDN